MHRQRHKTIPLQPQLQQILLDLQPLLHHRKINFQLRQGINSRLSSRSISA
jgi:hypothetical protein